MTKGVKDGLGLLCFAAIALVISLAGSGGEERSLVADAAGGIAAVLAMIGLGMIGWSLARN